jgi:hypothetical protein
MTTHNGCPAIHSDEIRLIITAQSLNLARAVANQICEDVHHKEEDPERQGCRTH